MTPFLTAAFLLLCLIVVHRSTRTSSLVERRPLNVEDLPWPWAAHGSSIFSLNALFGAYLVTTVAVGLAGAAGLAAGSIVGFLMVARLIGPHARDGFEAYLSKATPASSTALSSFIWRLLAATQIAFATSELLLLRGISMSAFGLTARGATSFCISVCLIAYIYTVMGGYGAVFRTDIVQFVFVVAMCLLFAGAAIVLLVRSPTSISLPVDGILSGSWTFSLPISTGLRRLIEFLIGTVIGASFLLASPDTWKRVLVASQGALSSRGLVKMVVSGSLPFLLLIPVVLVMPKPESSDVEFFWFLKDLCSSPILILGLVLGMSASFLSSFDSSLLASTHLLLWMERGDHSYSIKSFHYRIGGVYLAILFLFLFESWGIRNPYAIGLLISGLYAILAALFLGTRGFARPILRKGVLWVLLILLVGWFQAVVTRTDVFQRPHASHLALAPIGVSIFFFVFLVSLLTSTKELNHARRSNTQ